MIANHLWQSTLLVAVAAAALRLTPRTPAAMRHVVWTLASLKFLVPFAALVSAGAALGGWLAIPGVDNAAAAAAMTSASRLVAPFRVTVVAATDADATLTFLSWSFVLTLIWVAGALAVLTWRIGQQRRANHLFRRAVVIRDGTVRDAVTRWSRRLGVGAALSLVETPESVEPAVIGWLRPVLLWPAGLERRLSRPQLDAILLHELAHVRRRDNLWATLQTAVEVICWFHPLVWWMNAQLVRERERACDDEVLACGVDAAAYAGGLLAVGRFAMPLSAPAVAGVIGFPLTKRVEAIMSSRGMSMNAVRVRGTALIAVSMLLAPPMAAGAMQATPAVAAAVEVTAEPAIAATPAVTPEPAIARVDSDTTPAVTPIATPARSARPARAPMPAPVASTDQMAQQPAPAPAAPATAPSSAPESAPATPAASPAPTQTPEDIEFRRGTFDGERPDLVKPVAINKVEPKYTREALRDKVQGTVTLEIVVAPNGAVSRARVTQSLDPRLDEEALNAAKSWVFEPGVLSGRKVPVLIKLDVEFRVH